MPEPDQEVAQPQAEHKLFVVILSIVNGPSTTPEQLAARAKGLTLATDQMDLDYLPEIAGNFEQQLIRLTWAIDATSYRNALNTVCDLYDAACIESPLVGGPSIPAEPAGMSVTVITGEQFVQMQNAQQQQPAAPAEPGRTPSGLIVPS